MDGSLDRFCEFALCVSRTLDSTEEPSGIEKHVIVPALRHYIPRHMIKSPKSSTVHR